MSQAKLNVIFSKYCAYLLKCQVSQLHQVIRTNYEVTCQCLIAMLLMHLWQQASVILHGFLFLPLWLQIHPMVPDRVNLCLSKVRYINLFFAFQDLTWMQACSNNLTFERIFGLHFSACSLILCSTFILLESTQYQDWKLFFHARFVLNKLPSHQILCSADAYTQRVKDKTFSYHT